METRPGEFTPNARPVELNCELRTARRKPLFVKQTYMYFMAAALLLFYFGLQWVDISTWPLPNFLCFSSPFFQVDKPSLKHTHTNTQTHKHTPTHCFCFFGNGHFYFRQGVRASQPELFWQIWGLYCGPQGSCGVLALPPTPNKGEQHSCDSPPAHLIPFTWSPYDRDRQTHTHHKRQKRCDI